MGRALYLDNNYIHVCTSQRTRILCIIKMKDYGVEGEVISIYGAIRTQRNFAVCDKMQSFLCCDRWYIW